MHDERVVRNTAWLIGCRIVQALLGFIISMMTARFLGPSKFGLINYAASIVAFFVPVMKLGLDAVLVQEIVQNPNEDGKILGTGLRMCTISAIFCMIGVIAFSSIADRGEIETIVICSLYSVTLLAQAVEMIMYWFHAKLMSKYVSTVSLFAYIVVSVYKIFLLTTEKEVYWFAVSYAIDYLIIGITLRVLYSRCSDKKLEYSPQIMRRLWAKGKYYVVSGLMTVVYAQTDRVMLKMMIDEIAVGYYSAGVTCASIATFVFSAYITSMQPVIFEGQKQSIEAFETRVKQLYSIIVYMAVAESVFLCVFSKPLVNILYGEQYAPTVGVLRIICWYTAFSYYGAAKDVWILAESKQKYLVWLNCAGAVTNAVLNFFLIPVWGINGAAFASLTTQILTNVIMVIFIKELSRTNYLLIQSLNPKYMFFYLRKLRHVFRLHPRE